MGWRNAAAGVDSLRYLSVRDIAVLFSVQSRTVYDWINKWQHTARGIRIWYHPDYARPANRRLFWPLLHVHIDDVLWHAREAGFTIADEIVDEILERVDGSVRRKRTNRTP